MSMPLWASALTPNGLCLERGRFTPNFLLHELQSSITYALESWEGDFVAKAQRHEIALVGNDSHGWLQL